MKIIEANGIAPNEQLFVRYRGDFFGSNYEDCMCPHTEFYGDHVRAYEPRSRSGLTSREFLVEVTFNEATGSATLSAEACSTYKENSIPSVIFETFSDHAAQLALGSLTISETRSQKQKKTVTLWYKLPEK